MAAKTNSAAAEAVKQLTYLAGALKAPRITEAAARLADHARDAGWTRVHQQVAALASGVFLTEARNVVLLGPPGTGKSLIWPPAWEWPRPTTATASCPPQQQTGSPA